MSTKKLPKKSQQQEQLMKDKRTIAEDIHNNVRNLYHDILKNPYAYYSPMVVSKLLIALKQLRHSLEELQELQMRSQEELAWLILNACKLIYDIAQPLIWNSCGKYVIETLGFAVLSMEAVINLCTIRHMNFRMKLYSSMFYCALSQGNLDQAQGTWDHCQKEIKELIEREELDPPLPDKSIECLSESLEDLFIMKFVLDCWRDNDAINFNDVTVEKYRTLINGGSKYYRNNASDLMKELRNRMIEEFNRVHLLASGNANETYMKRSASLAKAMLAIVGEKKGENGDGLLTNFVIQSTFEVAYTTIIDNESMNEDVFAAYSGMFEKLEISDSKEFKEKLDIFYSLQKFINHNKLDSECIMNLKSFIEHLNELLYVESSYRSKSVYVKLILALFKKIIYQPLQVHLSEKAPKNEKFFKSISRPLEVMVKVLDLTFSEDPIVTSSLALLCGHVMFQIKEYRDAISLLKQALHSIEDHRAARIDFLSQLPEDVRDILALQRNAFTTRSDMNDWFHSVKRLGAHAFAGFGIFGSGSSADRSDQALAEIHTDILSLYFRVELHYGYLYYRDQTIHRKERILRKQQEEAEKLDTAPKKGPSGSNKAKTMKKDASTTSTGSSKKTSLLPADFRVDVNMEKLPATQALRAYCAKNKYALTILNLEMAKLEVDSGRRLKYLQDAHSFIDEVESQEETLVQGFQNLTITTDSERKYPIVLSRSHRYIYVAPVACRKLKKAVYYKVLAKEKGSGTDVSIYNNDLPGCEKVIPCEKFVNNFKEIVVRIGPLRNGELYMFGCAGYADNDQVVGAVSPSSPVVEAVNPLPTILLWSYLAETCHVLGYPDLSMDSAIRVCNRFLMKTPIRDVVSMTSGVNLFLYEESTVCALALQQSTVNLITHFVNSFILYESLHFHKEMFGKEIQWNKRQYQQLRYLISLNRCAAVVNITTSINHQELTVKCVCLGVMLLTELMKFDELPLARYLQSSVTTFLLALQRISKRHWHDLEHKLYNKLMAQGLQLAVINRDLSPMISIFNEFYVESREKVVDELTGPSPAVFQWIESTITMMEQHLVPKHRENLVGDLKKLFFTAEEQKATESPRAGADSVASFWQLTNIQRRLKVSGLSLDMIEPPNDKSSPERIKLEKNMFVDLPKQYSDYLALVVQLMKDLFNRNRMELVEKLVQRMPIVLDYLNEKVQAVINAWDVSLILSLSEFIAMKQAADANAGAAGGKKAPPKKGAAPEPDVSLADQLAVPERFKALASSAEEDSLQMAYVSEILQMLVAANAKVPSTVNYFINSYYGPRQQVDLTHGNEDHSIEEKVGESNDMSSNQIDKDAARKGVVNKHSLVKYFLVAMDLLIKANKPDASVNAMIKLWNWLIAEYLDPVLFVKEFSTMLSTNFIPVLVSLSDVVDRISYQHAGILDVNPILSSFVPNVDVMASTASLKDISSQNTPVTEYVVRDCKEKMSLIVDMINFFIKSIWLMKQFPEQIVLYSSRIFTLFYLNAEVDVVMKLGDAILPLILESQETLIHRAQEDLSAAKQQLTKFVNDYEEAQQKKRKKKLRVARLEKDEEELAFEAEKGRLEEIVNDKQAFLKKREQEMEYVQHQQSLFHTMVPKGQQLLQRAKKTLQHFVESIEKDYGKNIDFRLLLLPSDIPLISNANASHENDNTHDHHKQVSSRIKHIHEGIEQVEITYKKAIKFLRENKEKVALTEALTDLTNFLIRFGLFDHSKQYLFDIVDGLFNTMDACIHWYEVIQQAKESFDFHLVSGLIYVIIALSKLSKYYTYQDYETKANYARMAAACSLFLFDESIHHPKKLIGFAAYECLDLGGFQSFPISTLHEIFVALHDLIPVLLNEDHDLVALPLICVGEFLSGIYLRNPRFWLDMRKYRLRVLIKQHLFAEAISMLAGIKSRVQSIYDHSYADVLRKANNSSVDSENLNQFEVRKNGLCFYDAPVFYNNQLPSTLPNEPTPVAGSIENTNGKALEWVASMVGDLETFLTTKFVVKVPESELSEEEKQKLAAKRLKAQEEAAELAKKSKGKGPPPVEVNVEADLPTLSLFTSTQMIDLHLLCGYLLSEVAMLDGSMQNTKTLSEFRVKQLVGHAKTLFVKVKDMLFNKFSTNDIEEDYALRLIRTGQDSTSSSIDDPNTKKKDFLFTRLDWFDLYSRFTLLENRVTIYLRHYRQALLSLNNFMKLLQHPQFNQGSLVQGGDMKYAITNAWLQTRWMLILLAERQANHTLTLELLEVTKRESEIVHFQYFIRKCFMLRSKTLAYHKKEYVTSLQDCEEFLSISKTSHLIDAYVVDMMVHQAYLYKEQMRYYNIDLLTPTTATSSSSSSGKDERGQAYHMYKQMVKILEILREAYRLGKQVMEIAGGFPADYNITFSRAESNITGYHLLSPPLHIFTDIHNNEMPLTVTATEVNELENNLLKVKEDLRRLGHAQQDPNTLISRSQQLLPQSIRLGPIDNNDHTFTPSEYCNIYLKESRALVSCQVSLLSFLDDLRNNGIDHWMQALIDQIEEDKRNGMNKKAKPLIDLDEENLQLLNKKDIIMEEIAMAEETLKVRIQYSINFCVGMIKRLFFILMLMLFSYFVKSYLFHQLFVQKCIFSLRRLELQDAFLLVRL